jgi:hypothetical protein
MLRAAGCMIARDSGAMARSILQGAAPEGRSIEESSTRVHPFHMPQVASAASAAAGSSLIL